MADAGFRRHRALLRSADRRRHRRADPAEHQIDLDRGAGIGVDGVPDLPAICRAAHDKGVLVALDNTWSAGLALRGFELGVDIIMQALTKYQSGGSDVLMGAVITRDQLLHERLSMSHMRLGMGVGADDAYLVLRGLPTMKLRFDAHDAGARKLAAWFKTRPEITRVLHPALADCPGHDIWKRDFS